MEMPDCDDELYRRFHGRQHEPEQRVDFVTNSTFRTVVFPAEYVNNAVDNFYDPSPGTIQADEPQYYSAPSPVASHTFGKPTSSYPRSFTLDDDEEDEDWSVQHGFRPPLFPDNPGWGSATAETERWNAYYGHGTAITTGDQVPGYDDYYPSTDVGRSESPRRGSDISVHFQNDRSGKSTPARGLLDSGNQFGPLISLDTALKLGFRRGDFTGGARVLQSVGGSEHVTAGSIPLRYYLNDDHTNPLETDFHVLEMLGGEYDVNLPTDGLVMDPGEVPVAAFLVAPKREPTAAEISEWEETLRQAEAEQRRAEIERARRKAADREKKARMRIGRR